MTGRERVRRFFDKHAAVVFLFPWICGLVILFVIPLAVSLFYSFSRFSLLSGAPAFHGLKNYIDIFTRDYHFIDAAKVTLKYVFFSVPLQLIMALILALILNKGVFGLSLLRALYYIPSLLGASVAIAILWRQIFGIEGVLNIVLGGLGFEEISKISWIGSPTYAVWTLITLRMWQFGSPMIIFLAGLKQIPTEIIEAADIDGAQRWKKFVRITLPLLSPIMLFNFVMQIISAFKVFTEAFIISAGTGGAMNSLLFYTIHIYNEAFQKFRMGYASALAWVFMLAVGLLTWIAFSLSKNRVYYN